MLELKKVATVENKANEYKHLVWEIWIALVTDQKQTSDWLKSDDVKFSSKMQIPIKWEHLLTKMHFSRQGLVGKNVTGFSIIA